MVQQRGRDSWSESPRPGRWLAGDRSDHCRLVMKVMTDHRKVSLTETANFESVEENT